MIKLETYILLKEYQTNTYLLYDTESQEAMLIDPAAYSESLAQHIRNSNLRLKLIVNTHGHGDHIGANAAFARSFGCPIAIHSLDAPMLSDGRKNLSLYMGYDLASTAADQLLKDGDVLMLGEVPVKVIHTPGHTKGSLCLLVNKYLVSGDTLFEQSIGRTDLPGGDHAAIIASIQDKLFVLPDDVLVYPGHGPATSIGLEKVNNPFVKER